MQSNDNDKNPWDVFEESKIDSSAAKKEKPNPWAANKDKSTNHTKQKDSFFQTLENDFFAKLGLKKKFSNGDGNGYGIVFIIITIIFLIWLGSGFYRVQEGEVAVVMRFGEMVRLNGSGWGYHLPAPIEEVIIRELSAVNKIDSNMQGDYKSGRSEEHNLVLTGDENMVVTSYTVFWKIKDIAAFLFNSRKPEATIIVAAESAVREVIGQTMARLALTEGREEIAAKISDVLQKILDHYDIGVQIINVQLQLVGPPKQVIDKFNDVLASLVDADRFKNEAEAYRNSILPQTRGVVAQIINEAEGYKKQSIARANGEAARFSAVLEAIQDNEEVTITRYHLEAVENVLKNAKTTIVDSKIGQGIVPYYNLQPHSKIDESVSIANTNNPHKSNTKKGK